MLEELGWNCHTRMGDLLVYLNHEGHQLLVLTRTRRVQIRLHYLTPGCRRPDVARGIFDRLFLATDRRSSVAGPP